MMSEELTEINQKEIQQNYINIENKIDNLLIMFDIRETNQKQIHNDIIRIEKKIDGLVTKVEEVENQKINDQEGLKQKGSLSFIYLVFYVLVFTAGLSILSVNSNEIRFFIFISFALFVFGYVPVIPKLGMNARLSKGNVWLLLPALLAILWLYLCFYTVNNPEDSVKWAYGLGGVALFFVIPYLFKLLIKKSNT